MIQCGSGRSEKLSLTGSSKYVNIKIYYGETLRFAKSYLTCRSRSISPTFIYLWRWNLK